MPLSKKGKKIMKSMKDQYGSKRGEQVFYASMNKGTIKGVEKMQKGGLGVKSGPPPKKGPDSQGVTLKSGIKVLKAKGGADASKADFKTPSSSPFSAGYSGAKNTVTRGGEGSSSNASNQKPVKTSFNTQVQNIGSNLQSSIPFTKAGLAIGAVKALETARRKKRAKGEFVFSKKKTLPITREFYRTEGRPIDYTVGGKDEGYFKATGITGGPKGTFEKKDGPKTIMCPDGTFPPCVDTTKTTPIGGGRNKVNPFQFNFQYKDGGMVRGSGKILKNKIKKARLY